MRRLRMLLASGVVAVVGLAVASPSASAFPPPTAHPPANASCVGLLSSFVGSRHFVLSRSDFAPLPGQDVAALAQQKPPGPTGLLVFCAQAGGIPIPPD